jgi:dynein heavy chain
VLAVDQINWTLGVEKAFGKRDLNNFKEHMNQDINRIVKMVRGQLLPMLRVTLKALVVLQVHGRTVVQDMIDQKVTDMSDFKWSSQLRYYWEDKDMLRVKMVTAVIDYGFEYLGNSPRLVITPLTDRCYRTLMGAKNL